MLPPSGEEMNPAYSAQVDGVAVGRSVEIISQREVRSAARSRGFDGQSGDEMVQRAGDGVDGNPGWTVQVTPSVEVLITRSFEEHPVRKRQSCQIV